jgi:hypothetical protein
MDASWTELHAIWAGDDATWRQDQSFFFSQTDATLLYSLSEGDIVARSRPRGRSVGRSGPIFLSAKPCPAQEVAVFGVKSFMNHVASPVWSVSRGNPSSRKFWLTGNVRDHEPTSSKAAGIKVGGSFDCCRGSIASLFAGSWQGECEGLGEERGLRPSRAHVCSHRPCAGCVAIVPVYLASAKGCCAG